MELWQELLIVAGATVLGYLLGALDHWWPYVKIAGRKLTHRRTYKKMLNADFKVSDKEQKAATRFRQRTANGGSAGIARVRIARIRFRAPRGK